VVRVVLLCMAFALGACAAANSDLSSAENTQSTAVTVASQSVEGQQLYAENCARCHGEDLTGGDQGTPLRGSRFQRSWNGQSSRELYRRIISTMPLDNPGSLSEQQSVAVTRFLLSRNGLEVTAQRASDLEHATIAF
jgi:mono/diheme cytochrome c family protein